MALGGLIFLFGVLIWVEPDLLAYLVAAAFCAVGLSIMGFAWRLRGARPVGGSTTRGRPRGNYVEFRLERDEEVL